MDPLSGIVLDFPEKEYHAHPALSATGAKLVLDSPAMYDHVINKGNNRHKAAFDLGSAVHAKVLGTGWGIEELDFPDFRTKAAQEARDAAYAADLIPMLKKDLVQVHAMAEAVLAHSIAGVLFEQEGHAEASVFATCPSTGVELRCRFDYLGAHAVDLKTTAGKASAKGFAKSAADFGYDVQRGHYLDTLKYATGEEKEMVFVVVETAAPHLVAVHQLDRDFREMGEAKALAARMLYRKCKESGEWPGYEPKINLLPPPMWAVYDFQERFNE